MKTDNMVWKRNRDRNFSKVETGTAANCHDSTTLMSSLMEFLCAGTCWGTSRTTSTSRRPGCRSTSPTGSRTCSSLQHRSALRLSPYSQCWGSGSIGNGNIFGPTCTETGYLFDTISAVQMRPFFLKFAYY